jgi:Tfp pilus assembly protein PilZ
LTERRSNKRISAKFKINYVSDRDYLISYTKDLSVDGMFICTQNPQLAGETIKLTFSIGKIDHVSIDAKVVWINSSNIEGESGMGVHFIDTPDFIKEEILQTFNKIAVLLDEDEKCG